MVVSGWAYSQDSRGAGNVTVLKDARIYSTHPAQAAGLVDVTPSFKFKRLGPHCMRVSLRPSV